MSNLLKVAVNNKQLAQAINTFKNQIVKRNIDLSGVITKNPVGYASKSLPNAVLKEIKRRATPEQFKEFEKFQNKIFARGDLSNYGISDVTNILKKLNPKDPTHAKHFEKGKSFIDAYKGLSPGEKEFFNRASLMHEKYETKYGPHQKLPEFFSHADPAVMLQEGNIYSTMPKEYTTLKKLLVELRSGGGENSYLNQMIPGYELNKTRLSRHNLEHISNLLKTKDSYRMNPIGTPTRKGFKSYSDKESLINKAKEYKSNNSINQNYSNEKYVPWEPPKDPLWKNPLVLGSLLAAGSVGGLGALAYKERS